MPLISIIILGFNSKKFLRWCLDSVLSQSYPNLEIIYVDNASADGSYEFTEQFLCSTSIKYKIIKNAKNIGYTGGNNIGIKNSRGEYILCLNPDIILDKDYVKNIINLFQKNPKTGAVIGKLLKSRLRDPNLQIHPNDPNIIEKTDILDSCGFRIFKSHRVIEQGGGEFDHGQYNHTQQIFGASGAAPIYREIALEKINAFDRDFFAYKEDVDLAFRLLHAGYENWFEPRAIAWHHRWETGTRDGEKSKDVIARRRKRSKFVNYLSYRNHLYFLLKNEFLQNLLMYSPWIITYELKKLIFGLLFEKEIIRGLLDFAKNLSLTIAKRRDILAKSTVKPKDIRKWLN